MGWCHEFGPQIFPTCDHPMVAGPDACSCPQCDTVCKGRFSGCADVWARGPRSVTVRVRPDEEPVRRSRFSPTVAADAVATVEEVLLDKLAESPRPPPARFRRRRQQPVEDHAVEERREHAADERRSPDHTPDLVAQLTDKVRQLESTVAASAAAAAAASKVPRTAPVDDRTPALVAQLADQVRRLEAAAAANATAAAASPKEPRAAAATVRSPDHARVEAVAKAVGGLAAGLDRLTAEVSELRKVPGRLDELEQARTSDSGTVADSTAVDRLSGDLAHLSTRVAGLTASVTRSEESGLGATVTRLADRVEELGKAQASLEAARASPAVPAPNVTAMVQRLEQRLEQLSAQLTPFDALAEQVRALETQAGPTDRQVVDRVERLAAQVEDLAAVVQSSRSTSAESPVQQGRTNAIERVVGELVRNTKRLSARVADLDEVPKRLHALETVEQAPVEEKALISLGKRLDRLSTQVGELKSLPDRVRAIEGESNRAETLTRGLGGAIDMIDELSAQVAAIQDTSRAANGLSG